LFIRLNSKDFFICCLFFHRFFKSSSVNIELSVAVLKLWASVFIIPSLGHSLIHALFCPYL
jgi:hypothetical protein